MNPETGRRFGPYELTGRVGGGGMGHVYRAWDARLHREVAIKLLHNEYAMPGMRERFLREARAASALNHPNICTVFDIGEQDGDPYLVMELLQGVTLKDRIQEKLLPVEDILCIAREAAEALGAAHAKGVIHRDIKPANIFLVDKPHGGSQAKVLDFGLAKIEGGVLGARTSRSLELTAAGSTVGTLAYMSPEQARGEVLDSRSDLFSLGVVLYEMATRHIPFQGATSALVFVKLLNHPPEPVRDWNEAVPRDLEKIIFKLMAKERTARFQTAHELWEALGRVSDKQSAGGGWLRKAVSSVPVARPAETATRDKEKRAPSKRRSEDSGEEPQRSLPPRESVRETARETVREPWAPLPDQTPRPVNDQPQFLRPVARVPRGDTTPRAALDSAALLTEALAAQAATESATPIPTANPTLGTSGTSKARNPAIPPGSDELPPEFASGSFGALSEATGKGSQSKLRLRFNPLWIGAAVVVLIVLGVGAALIANRGHFGPAALTEGEAVAVTEIENRTGDKSLDGTVAVGLQMALAQSPYLTLRGPEAYRIARRDVAPDAGVNPGQTIARNAAQRMGLKAYFYGTLKGAAAPYQLRVELHDVGSNDVITTAEERVASIGEIPDAIDRAADELRSSIGEDGSSITRNHVALPREATSNVDALHDFSLGDDAMFTGKYLAALEFYQHAVTLDPKFVQAHLRLSILYRKLRAELAASESAKLALSAADNSSERTRSLAQFQYEMNTSGDYVRASGIIRHLLTLYPHDSEALEELSRVLRLEGRMAESLQTAQQAYAEDPLNRDAYIQAENALIGLDRYDAAFQLQGQEQRLGLSQTGGMLTSAYLEGRQEAVDAAVAALQANKEGFRTDWNYGIYLDNTGHLAAGEALWESKSQAAQDIRGLESTSAFLLSQGALDRALLGDCAVGMTLARQSDDGFQGISALFNSAMANALCGDSDRASTILDELQHSYPQSFALNAFYLADVRAAIQLYGGDPAAALETLKPARQYDLISLTPLLRGRAHVALRQGQIGIVDYQTILAHRGVTFIVGSDVYPAAEVGVARAFADTGDLGNSAEAYRRFLDLWRTAEPPHPLLTEAHAHSK